MAGREAIRYQLAALTYWYQRYFEQERIMRHGSTEAVRWRAYEARIEAEYKHFDIGRWFTNQHVPLAYDDKRKEYYALTDPPLRPDMEAFLKVLNEKAPPDEEMPQPDSAEA